MDMDMKKRPKLQMNSSLALVFSAACAVPVIASAQEQALPFHASVYGSVERTDNGVQQRGGDSSTIKRLGLNADLTHDGRNVDYGLNGDASWADYSGSLPATLQGALSGNLNLSSTGGMVRWATRDSIRQSLLSAFGNSGPDNSEFVNSFSTGPTLNFHLGEVNSLSLGGTYSLESYEDSNFDSNSLNANASVSHSLSGGGSVGLNFSVTGTSYTSESLNVPGYDTREAFLSFRNDQRRRTALTLEAGYTESLSGGKTSTSPLFRLTLRRQASGISTVFFNASRQFSSAANQLPALGANGTYTPVSAPGAVKSSALDAKWLAQGRRTTLSLEGGWRQEDYSAAAQFDRSMLNFAINTSRQLRSNLTANMDLQYSIDDPKNPASPKYHSTSVGLSLNRQFGRRIGTGLTARYSQRSDDAISINEYSEWRFGLNVSYLLTNPGG